jgi:hypothetical protein
VLADLVAGHWPGATVVGHIGYTAPERSSSVITAGTTIAAPAHRAWGLMERMAAAVSDSARMTRPVSSSSLGSAGAVEDFDAGSVPVVG